MTNCHCTPEEHELILNTVAVEAERKVNWQTHAANLMAEYGITQNDVAKYIEQYGPLIKPKLLDIGSLDLASQALRDALKFAQAMRTVKDIPHTEQTINMARVWDKQKNSFGSSELTLKFALAKNPIEQFMYFCKLMSKYPRSDNRTEKMNTKQKTGKKFSRTVFEELILLGLTFVAIYQIFPLLPDVVFRQSMVNAFEFTFCWAIFKYIVFPTLFLFWFAVILIGLWRADKESRKAAITKLQNQLKTFVEMKWFPPISSFLFTLCPVIFMNFQHPYVFGSETWKGMLLAGLVLWFLQMFLYFVFRKMRSN